MQLRFALYANTGSTVEDHGLTTPTKAVVAGHSYTLVDRKFSPFERSPAHLSVQLPSSPKPLYAVSGVRGIKSRYVLTEPSGTLSKSVGVRSPEDAAGLLHLMMYEQTG